MAVAKVWDGSEWVPTKWKTYNGSEWVEQSKVWDGSEWVPIKGALPAVAFDAVGAGGSGQATGLSYNFSWTYTASGEGRAVVVAVAVAVVSGSVTGVTATYGSTPMIALTPRGYNNGSTGLTQQFILLNPPTGAQTVQVTVTHGGAFHSSGAVANSVSYNNVGSYTQGASSHGSGVSRTLTVTTASGGDMVVQSFGHRQTTAMSGYNQTQRSNLAPGGFAPGLVVGDSDEGDNSISFTATGSNVAWSGVSVILHPGGESGLGLPLVISVDSPDTPDRVVSWSGSGTPTDIITGVSAPSGVAVDSSGNVYVAQTGLGVVTRWDGTTQTDVITGLSAPAGVAVDSSGNVYVTQLGADVVTRWDGNTLTDVITGLSIPLGVAVDSSGNVYVTQLGAGIDAGVVTRWDGTTQTDIITGVDYPYGVAVDSSGNVYVTQPYKDVVTRWDGNTLTDIITGLIYPTDVAVDAGGNVYVAQNGAGVVTRWDGNTQTDIITGLIGLHFLALTPQ